MPKLTSIEVSVELQLAFSARRKELLVSWRTSRLSSNRSLLAKDIQLINDSQIRLMELIRKCPN